MWCGGGGVTDVHKYPCICNPHTQQVKETRPKGKGLMAGLAGKRTVTRTYKTPMLILCTGKHVTPYVPELPNDGSVPVIHSSQVRCAIDGFGRDV